MAIKRGVAFGCLHAPITHDGYFNWLIQSIEEFKPDYIVNLGDWYEGLAGSRHSRDERHDWDVMQEHRAVAGQASAFNAAAPNAKKVWLYGNHDDNFFGIHADRLPRDLRAAANWRNSLAAAPLEDWIIRERYRHGERYYLGQLSFGHGVNLADAGPRDECYSYAVPNGLDVLAHTHRPVAVTQCRERKVILPYSHCNVGTGADWDRMYYMDRNSKALWGRAALFFEVNTKGEGREWRATKAWDAEIRAHSYANPVRSNLRVG